MHSCLSQYQKALVARSSSMWHLDYKDDTERLRANDGPQAEAFIRLDFTENKFDTGHMPGSRWGSM